MSGVKSGAISGVQKRSGYVSEVTSIIRVEGAWCAPFCLFLVEPALGFIQVVCLEERLLKSVKFFCTWDNGSIAGNRE